jgi:transcriptional regulator with XRE-family HTH domain
MMDRKDVSGESASIPGLLGRLVPDCKAVLSHDLRGKPGHLVPMSKEAEKLAESEWRRAFQERVRQCQGKRSQEVMAELLGISRDSWNKIVNRGDQPSIRLLPKIAGIGEVSLEWLIDGRETEATAKKQSTTMSGAKATKRKRLSA